ncbi:MAG TPA: hypothetical protein VLW50_26225 [Streptosporangiaceae bacterium]|nr:hypothetical protein [Streptosporangiaceae bacterium]
MNGPLAGELQTLAEWLDEQLGGEEYSRQSIAETAASRVRELSAIAATAASYSRDRGRLTDAQRELLTRMASDACAYRRPGLFCNDCDDAPSGLCPDHEEDLDLTDAYIRLVRDLGGEVTT